MTKAQLRGLLDDTALGECFEFPSRLAIDLLS